MFDNTISFVTLDKALTAGGGGSVNYTVGQVRELIRRGIPAQMVTMGREGDGGRSQFPGIPFVQVHALAEVTDLDGPVVYVDIDEPLETKGPAYVMLHVPVPSDEPRRKAAVALADRNLIATSRYCSAAWSNYLGVPGRKIPVIYPFAAPCFSAVARPPQDDRTTRLLFAGRLSPEKGIYTLLEALSLAGTLYDVFPPDFRLSVTVTASGSDKSVGKVIAAVLEAHPSITLIPARPTPEAMAALMARHDVVVVPSNHMYWHEAFGMVSIEAQNAGCRVVASNDGGLPETDCGGLILVEPGNARELALGILKAAQLGPLSDDIRATAAQTFAVDRSVDSLLRALYGTHRQ